MTSFVAARRLVALSACLALSRGPAVLAGLPAPGAGDLASSGGGRDCEAPGQGPIAARYNEDVALQAAYLATAAYCTADAQLESWSCGDACDLSPRLGLVRVIHGQAHSVGHAYVGLLGADQCVVAFRGTANLRGWLKDLESARMVDFNATGSRCDNEGRPCRVAEGFFYAYRSIAAALFGNLTAIGCGPSASGSTRTLLVTGHSLGAAEVAYAMYDLMGAGHRNVVGITFGQPRVGNRDFKAAFESRLNGTNSVLFRVTHATDPVVHLPMRALGFSHLGAEAFYVGNVSNGSRICEEAEDNCCADRFPDILLPKYIAGCMQLKRASREFGCPHLAYLIAAKTTPMDGRSCNANVPGPPELFVV